jgi:hypothetical protein
MILFSTASFDFLPISQFIRLMVKSTWTEIKLNICNYVFILFMVHLTTLTVVKTIQRRVTVPWSEVPFRHLSKVTDKNHEKPQEG